MESKLKYLQNSMAIEPEELASSLAEFIKVYVKKLEREGVIIGLSGGIDSAVIAALCKRGVGAENTLALILPEKDSRREHQVDAQNFADELGIATKLIDLTPYLEMLEVYKLSPVNRPFLPEKIKGTLIGEAYDYYQRKTGETPFSASLSGLRDKEFDSYLKKGNAYYRVKHRLRMLLLYLYAELENRLVVGSTNKSEYEIGFFVKYGCDSANDILPLLNLYKTQVRELARYLNIPAKIMEKPPSPDILPGLTDEKALSISYEKLDLILMAIEKGWEVGEIAGALEISEKQVIEIERLIQKSEHMRKIYAPSI
ncbi:MAG TPA: NAD(+) synthase [Candidatus Marinimicrobia bacterium]|nr:NAD(+) synthase [Candidatus Neomarinimicrobiota bacterium]